MKTNLSLLIASGKRLMLKLADFDQRMLSHSAVLSRFGAVLFLAVAIGMFFVGRWSSPTPGLMHQTMMEMEQQIGRQQQMLEQLSSVQEMNVNALAVRLAELQASSTRLDALGERLVQLGNLDPGEFDFNQPPPVGGPERIINGGHSSVADISGAIDGLTVSILYQMTRLDALHLLLLDRNLESERTPAGWPVSSGWISSGFGERNDPFTGKRTQHSGLDFAGIRGSEVLGVASGVVIWAGAKKGYGKTLEIEHGNGYVTRYAHNEALLVTAGDRVTAGQLVAKMGTTGRASSPHVHFEVLYKGEAVNPSKFVKQGR